MPASSTPPTVRTAPTVVTALPAGLNAGSSGVGVVELDVTGMTCASCAARIERKLNKLPGRRRVA